MRYVVVDLEMNRMSSKSKVGKCNMEIIEIGATILDDYYQEISTFQTYVKPEYNEKIAPLISKLTGITDDMVVNAPGFSEALKRFTDWCLSSEEEIVIYAWSESDYNQIQKEMQLKNYKLTEKENKLLNEEWRDLQKLFDNKMGFERQVSLKLALDMAGVEFTGQQHDALDDARNTAELFRIFNNKELFEITLSKIEEIMKPKALNTALGSMFDFSSFILA